VRRKFSPLSCNTGITRRGMVNLIYFFFLLIIYSLILKGNKKKGGREAPYVVCVKTRT